MTGLTLGPVTKQLATVVQRLEAGHGGRGAAPDARRRQLAGGGPAAHGVDAVPISVLHQLHVDPKKILPDVWGGNIHDRLTDKNIDDVLAPILGRRYGLPARFFYDLREATGEFYNMTNKAQRGAYGRQRIAEALEASSDHPEDRWLYVALHVRHHWTGAFICHGRAVGMSEHDLVLVVFDSAPSPITATDIQRLNLRPTSRSTPTRV